VTFGLPGSLSERNKKEEQNMSKHRSRIAFRGQEYHLGYFDTPEEARLVKDAVSQFLKSRAPGPPSLHSVCRLVNMGIYDGDITSLRMGSFTLAKRAKMVTDMARAKGSPYGSITADSEAGIS
jgi:hypothetical protein